MEQGGYRRGSRGFTIVEVLIVLVVTSALFVAAAVLINGKQNKTQFMTATNDFLQQLQQISNETSSGYSEAGKVTCTAGSSTQPTLTLGASDLGTQGDCIFLGKVLQVGIGSQPLNQAMHLFPVVGNRLSGDEAVTSLSDAYPIALTAAQGGTDLNLESGLWLDFNTASTRMGYVPAASPTAPPIPTRGVGFMSSLGDVSAQTSGGSAQQLSLYAVDAGSGPQPTTVSSMQSLIDKAHLAPAAQVIICVESGGTNQSAQFTIGNDSNPVAVQMKIFYTKGCV
jgi:prepilin-type N-terminal cleavage/methylation domain-containing protein